MHSHYSFVIIESIIQDGDPFTMKTAQLNLIRQEKAKISSFLRSICHSTIQDEYTLYHEFSDFMTKRDLENVNEAVDYIRNKHSLFMTEISDQMKNFVTEEHIPTETTHVMRYICKKTKFQQLFIKWLHFTLYWFT